MLLRNTPFALLLGLSLLFAGRAAAAGHGSQIMNSREVLNSRVYGDAAATSFLPVSGRLQGLAVWKTVPATADTIPESDVRHLAIASDQILAFSDNEIRCFDKNGTMRWRRMLGSAADWDVEDGGYKIVSSLGYYGLVPFDGQNTEMIQLPWTGRVGTVPLMTRNGNELRYVAIESGSPARMPGHVSIPPCTFFRRYDLKLKNANFAVQLADESALQVCSDKDENLFAAAFRNEIQIWNSNLGPESQRIHAKCTGLRMISFDHDGNLLSVEIHEKSGPALVTRNAYGEELRVKPLSGVGAMGQPPASAPDGTVYLLMDSVLTILRRGKQPIEIRFAVSAPWLRFTVLADNSVLAAAGQELVHLSAAGEELGRIRLEHELTSRPVMDYDGRVYVGSKGGVLCIQ